MTSGYHMNKGGVLNEILKIPRRWDSVLRRRETIVKDCKDILPKMTMTKNCIHLI